MCVIVSCTVYVFTCSSRFVHMYSMYMYMYLKYIYIDIQLHLIICDNVCLFVCSVSVL